ncbi:hypothetical protein MMC21_007282 [Puttea exsequens]|nr:hypothetical protein [Puttea exsequens]
MFIEVSQNVAKFGIHAGLLRNASTIFDTVLNSAEKTEESEELFVAAESTTKTILADRIAWYPATQHPLRTYTDTLPSASELVKDVPWEMLFSTYIFAEKHGIPRLQNTIIDAVIQKVNAGALFPNQTVLNPL